MSEDDPRDEILWEAGWRGHETAQRRRLAALPLAEKLRWLEEAQQMVTRLREAAPGAKGTGAKPKKAAEDPSP